MHPASESFIQACRDQQVEPSRQLLNTLGAHSVFRSGIPLLGTIASTGTLLESPYWDPQRERPFVDSPLDPAAMPPDRASQLLTKIVNASTGTIPPVLNPDVLPVVSNPYGVCSLAERDWRSTYLTLRGRTAEHLLLEIYVEDGVPVLLRKGRGNPTGLLLAARALGNYGIEYPAGSIVQLNTAMDSKTIRQSKLRLPRSSLRIANINQVTALAFGRLSALAFTPEEQPTYFGPTTSLSGMPYVDDLLDATRNILPAKARRKSHA